MSLVCVWISSSNAKLLDRLRIQSQNSIVSGQVGGDRVILDVCTHVVRLRFVDVNSVESDISLVGTCAGDIAASRRRGLLGEQCGNISSARWQLGNLFGHKRIAECSIVTVN